MAQIRLQLEEEWQKMIRMFPCSSEWGTTEKIERRRMFFAGASSAVTIMMSSGDTEDQEMACIDHLMNELIRFKEDLEQGRA